MTIIRVVLAAFALLLHVAWTSDAQCLGRFTLMIAARNTFNVRLEGNSSWGFISYTTPPDNLTLSAPIPPIDRIHNFTRYLPREPVLIVISTGLGLSGHGLIASVSYDGRLIATTGDTNSKMKFITTYPPGSPTIGYWYSNKTYDDSTWPLANAGVTCSAASSPPMTNPDGYNYEAVIGANGIPPPTSDGGKVAKWVGASTDCSSRTQVFFRLSLDLAALAPEPACLPTTDPRSFLHRDVLLVRNTIGKPECGTKELKITVVAHPDHELYLNGMGKSFSVIGNRHLNHANNRNKIHTYVFNVPMGSYVIGLHVSTTASFVGDQRGMITLVEYDGQLYDVIQNGATQTFVATSIEPVGWKNVTYDDRSWSRLTTNDTCISNTRSKVSLDYLNSAGGCPKWIWPGECMINGGNTSIYYRFRLDLANNANRPVLPCPARVPGTPFNAVTCVASTASPAITSTTTVSTVVTASLSSTVTRITTQTVYTNAIQVTAVASVTSTRTVESVSTNTVFVAEETQTVTLIEEAVTTLTGDAEVTATIRTTVQNGSNNANQNGMLQFNNLWVVVGIAACGCLVTIGIAAVILRHRQRRQHFFGAATASGPELASSTVHLNYSTPSMVPSGVILRGPGQAAQIGIQRQ